MKLTFTIAGRTYEVESNSAIDLSIPLQFDGPQPNFYALPRASAKIYETEGFIADTRRGGSCNVRELRLTPHGNGTHTECVGHIVNQEVAIANTLKESWLPAALISVEPLLAKQSGESYQPKLADDALLVTAQAIEHALSRHNQHDFLAALIIRTLPNSREKLSRVYNKDELPLPACFSREAMHKICELKVQHLLIDLPSLDYINDEGLMSAHHLYWNVPVGEHDVVAGEHSLKTITEMIFVADAVVDGCYLLDLQIPAFVSDAAPSRPLLYPMTNKEG